MDIKLCPKCKTGAESYALDPKSPVCPYLQFHNVNASDKMKENAEEKMLSDMNLQKDLQKEIMLLSFVPILIKSTFIITSYGTQPHLTAQENFVIFGEWQKL